MLKNTQMYNIMYKVNKRIAEILPTSNETSHLISLTFRSYNDVAKVSDYSRAH